MTNLDTIDKVLNKIEVAFDRTEKVKLSVMFANNTSGKTRLSKLFSEKYEDNVLCYNAFLGDLFSWDNEDYILKVNKDSWVSKLIIDEGIDKQIIDNFKKFTNSKIEPKFDLANGKITFNIPNEDSEIKTNIKISKGEESLFIWSIFYTILNLAVDELIEQADDRSTDTFNQLKYIIIDDPVSSMDDSRIIAIAIELSELINKIASYQNKMENELKILVTTHHALFFKILHKLNIKGFKQKDFILSRNEELFFLIETKSGEPFAYHHSIIIEIQKAIQNRDIKKYHFNLFRSLLEKTANFLGYSRWNNLLEGYDNKELLEKVINQFSHSQLSETEPKLLEENYKEIFKDSFEYFMIKYKWSYEKNDEI